MAKSQWVQWGGLDEFREQMDRMLDAAGQGPALAGASCPGYVWTPLADITETAEALTVRIELPGVTPEQLLVEVADGALVVRGERPSDCACGEDVETAYHLMERAHGPFARRFPLPEDADGESICAQLREGLLTVTVPKRRATLPLRRTLKLD
ncbi:MAG: Hsp20/alpha crystallin family protein [Proteobacteria bacterium]|nr:Hsp20/alpha crystallin family protein [Pseudomonadota bacterium]